MIKDLHVATITWARDEEEEALLITSLTQLAELGLPTFITDGGSGSSFISFLKSFPNFTVLEPKEKGLWAQAKNSLLAARDAGCHYILYSEPDKLSFFSEFLKDMLAGLVLTDNDGIVLATRTQKGFSSFPAFQQMSETTINNCCAEMTGKGLDYTYGPFILNSQLVSHAAQLHEDIGWGWRPYMFVLAARLGLSITSYEKDFYCPADQQQDDPKERLYRMRQLEQNIRGIVSAATVQLDKI